MNNLLTELRAYFAAHTREEILKDWEATAEYDEISIPVEEFLSGMKPYHYKFQTTTPTRKEPRTNIGTSFNPESTSGFFISQNFRHYAMQYA